jgi:two-component system, NtrC family, response regulator HydG
MSTPDLGHPRGRILVVEDDSEAAYYAVHVLTRMGHFDAVHTLDPVVALRRVTAESWDLVLTDVDLPGMTGLELLRALREAAPALPVAVITAHITNSADMDALRERADAFLEKPVPPARLVAVAAALIARSAARPSA